MSKCICSSWQLLRGPLYKGSSHLEGCPVHPARQQFEAEMAQYDSMDDLEYTAWGFPFADLGDD